MTRIVLEDPATIASALIDLAVRLSGDEQVGTGPHPLCSPEELSALLIGAGYLTGYSIRAQGLAREPPSPDATAGWDVEKRVTSLSAHITSCVLKLCSAIDRDRVPDYPTLESVTQALLEQRIGLPPRRDYSTDPKG